MGFPAVATSSYVTSPTIADETKLDFYHRNNSSESRPIAVYIHGGAYNTGDKSIVGKKADFAYDNGMNFVSVNYPLSPDPITEPISGWDPDRFKCEHANYVAKALKVIQNNAASYGGDPDRILLLGHSAGAAIVASLCVNTSLLTAESVDTTGILGAVLLDVDLFDLFPSNQPMVANAFGIQPARAINPSTGLPYPFANLDYASQAAAEAAYDPYTYRDSSGNLQHLDDDSIPICLCMAGPSGRATSAQDLFDEYENLTSTARSYGKNEYHYYPGTATYTHDTINQCVGAPSGVILPAPAQDPGYGKSVPSGMSRISTVVLDYFTARLND